MNTYRLSLSKVSFMTWFLGIYYAFIAFSSLTAGSLFKDNIYLDVISSAMTLTYIYILDRLKAELNTRLNLFVLNSFINLLILIGAFSIIIDVAIKLNYFNQTDMSYIYLFMIYADSIVTLLFIQRFKVLFILPHAKEFAKWSKLSSIMAMTLILYPLALLFSSFSFLSLSKFFRVVEKIKSKQ